MQGIKFKHNRDYANEYSKRYPENQNRCNYRISQFAGELIDKYGKKTRKGRTAHIVVSHANISYAAKLVNEKTIAEHQVNVPSNVGYTGIAAAQISGKTVTIIRGGDIEHLKDNSARKHLMTRLFL